MRIFFIVFFSLSLFAVKNSEAISVKCVLCEAAVEVLRKLYEKNATEEAVIKVAIYICEHYVEKEVLVCQGIISQFRDSFLYVFEQLAFRPSQLCGLLLTNCGTFVNPFDSNWTIPLPLPYQPENTAFNIGLNANSKAKGSENSNAHENSKPLRVLQLSDLHFDPKYEPDSETDCESPICCQVDGTKNATEPKTLAGYWGSVAKCDIPYWTIVNMLQYINTTHKIDYVMLTGDFMSHSDWTYTKAEHRQVIQKLNKTLNEYLPGIPIFWTIGNHEGVPINSFAPHFAPAKFRPDWLYREVVSAGQRWISDGEIPLALYRGSYAVNISDRLKLISLNTGYCETTNLFLYINQTDPDNTLSWLVDELYGSEMNDQFAHISAHIPPGDAECLEGWARNYYRIVNRFQKVIKAQFFGHVHTDSFTVFYDDMNNYKSTPTGVLYSAPSVTTFEYLNPAYRIYSIDANSYDVLDFETYFLNISAIGDLPRWELLYSAKEEYGLKDLSAMSWHNLAAQIHSNETIYNKFLKNYGRRDDYECNDACRAELLCALRRGHHNQSAFCGPVADTAAATAAAKHQARQREALKRYLRSGNRSPDAENVTRLTQREFKSIAKSVLSSKMYNSAVNDHM